MRNLIFFLSLSNCISPKNIKYRYAFIFSGLIMPNDTLWAQVIIQDASLFSLFKESQLGWNT